MADRVVYRDPMDALKRDALKLQEERERVAKASRDLEADARQMEIQARAAESRLTRMRRSLSSAVSRLRGRLRGRRGR